ncbi:MAG TPA: enoyl-CoA hydratase/isomerase family protein [Candidatus Eisenbacteria bacterium]|nr:enoyl-CoA hydratase/isomerase family protein [Candidatus Eisenbacteria bacterium]
MPDLVLLAEADGVATLVLNRPEKLNAFDDDMRTQFVAAIDTLAARPGVRALVITGAGRAFCAGGDIAYMVRLKQERVPYQKGLGTLVATGTTAIAKLVALPFPTIACVNGAAAGGGANLALACDLRIASERASFGQSFVKIGMHVDWGGSWFLPRLVGVSKALELCWTGDMIDAAQALSIGLVNRVVPHERLDEETRSLAVRLAGSPQGSVRMAKQNLRASFMRTLDEALEAEYWAQADCWNDPDSDEGVRAFVEKRTPAYGALAAAGAASASFSAWRFE